MNKPTYLPEPHSDALRVGIKVHWLYFRDKAQAEAAAPIARHNASVAAAEGYDFGYQSPGHLKLIDHGDYAGMWEVCFP